MRLVDAYAHRHKSVQDVLRFFESDHLPAHLVPVSLACQRLAMQMVESLPDDPELVVGLRALLAAKDAFVRTQVVHAQTKTQELPKVPTMIRPDYTRDAI